MSTVAIDDNRYKFKEFIPSSVELLFVSRSSKRSCPLDIDAFIARAVTSNIPVEIVNIKPGELVSLPVSELGKTSVSYVGNPSVAEKDKYGNLQMRMPQASAVEVIFNSEKIGAVGKNQGAHGKKIIYIVVN